MTETKKPAEKEERNKIRGSRDKQSAPTLFPEGLVRGLHPDNASGINSSATGLIDRIRGDEGKKIIEKLERIIEELKGV